MHVIILPGFSPHNLSWAEDIKSDLQDLGTVDIVHWPHWETGKTERDWIEIESEKIANSIGENKVSIIAKSVGTIIAMDVLKIKLNNVERLILCGVSIKSFQENDEVRFQILSKVDSRKVAVFQNIGDPHGAPEDIGKLIHKYNPDIQITKKPRSDHEYPYVEVFAEFLTI